LKCTHPVDGGAVDTPLERGLKSSQRLLEIADPCLSSLLSPSLYSLNKWYYQKRRTGFFGERRTVQRRTSFFSSPRVFIPAKRALRPRMLLRALRPGAIFASIASHRRWHHFRRCFSAHHFPGCLSGHHFLAPASLTSCRRQHHFCSCSYQPTSSHGLSSGLLTLESYYGLFEKTGEQGVYQGHRNEEDEREKHTDLVPETATFNGSTFDPI